MDVGLSVREQLPLTWSLGRRCRSCSQANPLHWHGSLLQRLVQAKGRSPRQPRILRLVPNWRTPAPAGLYYPRGSHKARLCVAGKEALYSFCERHGVPHKRLGKLLVATSQAQLPALGALRAAAAANGVQLQPLSRAQARDLEPAVRCEAALLSPTTGIVDSHRWGPCRGWRRRRAP